MTKTQSTGNATVDAIIRQWTETPIGNRAFVLMDSAADYVKQGANARVRSERQWYLNGTIGMYATIHGWPLRELEMAFEHHRSNMHADGSK